MKPISPRIHGYLDYATVLLFLASPTLIGLTGAASMAAYALAGVHAILTLITDFPLGAAKLLAFPYHGWVERIVGPLLIVVPFGIGFGGPARILSITMGAIIVLVGWLSNYHCSSSGSSRIPACR